MKVNTINEIAPNDCRCGNWLKHWENYGNDFSMSCSVEDCAKPSEFGVEVQLDNSDDKSWYIIPFCYVHNKLSTEFKIKKTTTLVSASVESTCGK